MNFHKILIFFLISIVVISSVIFLWEKPLVLTLFLLSVALLKHIVLPVEKEIICFVLAGVLGALSESIAVFSGIWEYSQSQTINVPLWLIPLWGLTGVNGISFYEGLTEDKS